MSEITNYIDRIKTESDKITPQVLKAGVTAFGVEGALESNVRMYETITEMNEHTDLPENTYAIVFNTKFDGLYRLDNGVWNLIGDKSENQIAMEGLNDIDGNPEQMEGLGGTEEEILAKLKILYGREVV